MSFSPTTKKGYSLYDVASALQKEIRRANEESAMYWAWELYDSNFSKYLWKRLVMISIEDVGIAQPDALRFVRDCRDTFNEFAADKTNGFEMVIGHCILYLCRAQKSRIADYFTWRNKRLHNQRNLHIPDYALDMHTHRGKRMGKGVDDFFNEGSKVKPACPLAEEERYRIEFWQLKKMTDAQIEAAATCKVLPENHPDRDSKFKYQATPPAEPLRNTKLARIRNRTPAPETDNTQMEMPCD